MKAEDTVMKIKWMNKSVQEDQDKLLLDQADISFKAGEKLSLEKQGQAYLEGKQSGIKEVVEWINVEIFGNSEGYIFGGFKISAELFHHALRAKMKEWNDS